MSATDVRPVLRLYQRLRDATALVLREGLKFGVVGSVAFLVDTGLFNLLLHVGEQPVLVEKPLTAKVISVAVATMVAWLGNRYWTFRRRRRAAVPRELFLFAVVNVGGLVLALLPLAVSRYVLGLESAIADNIAANVVGLALGTLFRFVMYRTVVFNAVSTAVDSPPGSTVGVRSGVVSAAQPEPTSTADQRGSRLSTNAATPSTRSGPETT